MSTTTVLDVDPKSLVEHPDNVRKDKGDLTALTASVKELGVLSPLLVTDIPGDGGFRIIAGRRRAAAAVAAGLATVPVIVRSDLGKAAHNNARSTLLVKAVQHRPHEPEAGL